MDVGLLLALGLADEGAALLDMEEKAHATLGGPFETLRKLSERELTKRREGTATKGWKVTEWGMKERGKREVGKCLGEGVLVEAEGFEDGEEGGDGALGRKLGDEVLVLDERVRKRTSTGKW